MGEGEAKELILEKSFCLKIHIYLKQKPTNVRRYSQCHVGWMWKWLCRTHYNSLRMGRQVSILVQKNNIIIMDSFKTEIIRILVFLAIISLVVFLKWWAILIVFIVFPNILRQMKNKRNGKINIGNLINYITNHIVR